MIASERESTELSSNTTSGPSTGRLEMMERLAARTRAGRLEPATMTTSALRRVGDEIEEERGEEEGSFVLLFAGVVKWCT